MPVSKNNNSNVKSAPKKADVILQTDREISYKVDKLFQQSSVNASAIRGDLSAVLNRCEKLIANNVKTANDGSLIAKQNSEIYKKLSAENQAVKQEINFLAMQNSSICEKLIEENAKLKQELTYMASQTACVYDKLSEAICALTKKVDYLAETLSAVDYDRIGDIVVEKTPVYDNVNYDRIGEIVAEKTPVYDTVDYDRITDIIAGAIPVQEVVSAEYIASMVADQIVIPEPLATLDEEAFAQTVSAKVQEAKAYDEDFAKYVGENLVIPQPVVNFNEEGLAEIVANKVLEKLAQEEEKAIAVAEEVSEEEVIEETAEQQVEEVIEETAEVAEESKEEKIDAEQLAGTISEKLDYDLLASKIYSKLIESGVLNNEPDYEEIATQLAEKVPVPAINEDAIADKAASILSNYMPEFDTADVADKITGVILPVIPTVPSLDYEELSEKVAEKISKHQENVDYDIVLDEEGINKITEVVSDEVKKGSEERFDKIDSEIDQIKAMLVAGAVVSTVGEIATSSAVEVQEETAEEVCEVEEEIPTVSEEVGEEELLTISDVVEESEVSEESDEGDVIEEIVEDIDEEPVSGEIMPDGIPGISNSVDFSSMMKYNRSFIARIIQGDDDVKQYYGQTKNALLAYKKVNSSVAWGAERFNKGRETVAKFKIRGKTLCLYLALDPNEYKKSVYHQVDVTNNKSMKGTPMMVKIKSPLGVKKAIRLIDDMLEKKGCIKQNVRERDYAAMYPYQTTEELIEDGLIKDVSKK